MWIFSELGFFSINRTPDGSDLQFRARREADLENLKAKFPQYFVGRDIMELPAADYRWRLETTDVYAGAIMAQMTAGISYRNFKSHLETTDQADKLGILHDLWHQLHEYQQEQRLAGSWDAKPGQRLVAGHHRREARRRIEAEAPREFSYELPTTDGGVEIQMFEDGTGATVYRSTVGLLGKGKTLLFAWNDYLFDVSQAPVDEAELAKMWKAYDAWKTAPPVEADARELFPDYLSRAAANEEAIEHGDEESDEVVQFFPIGAPPAEPPYDALTEAEQLDRDREIDDSNEPLPDDRVYWPDDEDDSDGSGM